ncbi:MAG: carboxymuconolactone decarboxylase family protein, partial [Pseudomonadales bacterium]|nr:carboxymuconolactone decarboxylase family protein [Pseudomonadales bacterium]
MSFIETTPSSQAQGEVRELYERQQGAFGFVPNYAKVYCHRPKVMRAWANLQSAIKKTISRKHYELATLSAARALNSSYCSIAHANTLKKH